MSSNRKHFVSGLAGVLVGAMLVGGPSAVAAIGDAIKIGTTNSGNARTTVQGSQDKALVKIVNTGTTNDNALQLQSDGPNLRVSNGKKIKKLNADRVDGYSANQLIRAAHAETLNAADANGATVSLSIDAPVNGTLVIGGTVNGEWTSALDVYTCEIQVDLIPIDGSIMSSEVDYAGATHTENKQSDCSTTGAMGVLAGPHDVTFYVGGVSTVALYGSTLWAIFVPFDGTGAPVVGN